LTVAPEVLVVDVLLRLSGAGNWSSSTPGCNHDVAVVIGLARLERLALQRGLDVIGPYFA
jgi:hypothetical protein